MQAPKNMKEVQRLARRIAALSQFISCSINKCSPFFCLLKKAFRWDEECNKAFGELKSYLAHLPTINQPRQEEVLYLYLSVLETTLSSVLVREEVGVQTPIYYTSRALRGAEERYPRAEKMALALVVTARRLRPYFQAHTIRGLTNQPLKVILLRPKTSGRLVKWSVEISEFDIEYHPCGAVKGQAIANFVSEYTYDPIVEPKNQDKQH